jgi:hypothetical protein
MLETAGSCLNQAGNSQIKLKTCLKPPDRAQVKLKRPEQAQIKLETAG